MEILSLNGSIITLGGQALSISSTPPSWKCVEFSNLSSTCPNYDDIYEYTCACICTYPAMSAGESFCICTSFLLYKYATDSPYEQYVSIKCNGTCIRGAMISTIGTCNCNGNFLPFTISYGDCVHAVVKAEMAGGELGSAYSQLYIDTVTGISGCFCVGNTNSIDAETCGGM